MTYAMLNNKRKSYIGSPTEMKDFTLNDFERSKLKVLQVLNCGRSVRCKYICA